jgi:hypothetical protein
VLRTPLLAFDERAALGARLASAATARDAPADLETALAADRARLRERLLELATRPEVREAIVVASPSLDESLTLWLERPDADRGSKVTRALFRYFARMTARATPFGLFAGISVGRVAADTRLRLEPRTTARKHARLDAEYVAALVHALGQHPSSIELAEQIFHADSAAALAWVTDHAVAADGSARWQLALRGIDQLIDDLGLSRVDKHRLAAGLRDDLQRRLRAGSAVLRAIGDRFRVERAALERLLDRTGDTTHPLAAALAVCARRSATLRPSVDELRRREAAGRLTRSIAEQAGSHVHLSMNRIARTQPLEQELVLCSFLARLYRSRLVRGSGD